MRTKIKVSSISVKDKHLYLIFANELDAVNYCNEMFGEYAFKTVCHGGYHNALEIPLECFSY